MDGMDGCGISSWGDVTLNKVTMGILAIVDSPPWNVVVRNSIIGGGITEPGQYYDNIFDISYTLSPSGYEGGGNINDNPLFCW